MRVTLSEAAERYLLGLGLDALAAQAPPEQKHNFSKQTERYLIEVGLQALGQQAGKEPRRVKGRPWSPGQREKFVKSMQSVWNNKRQSKNGRRKKGRVPWNKGKKTGKSGRAAWNKGLKDNPKLKWTPEHRRKFIATMAKRRAEQAKASA